MYYSTAISQNQKIHQLDILNAFLNGDLIKTIYMKQPPGFSDRRCLNRICLLRKSHYGLKQPPHEWLKKLSCYSQPIGIIGLKIDTSLFYKYNHNTPFLIHVYVQDILILRPDSRGINFSSPHQNLLSRSDIWTSLLFFRGQIYSPSIQILTVSVMMCFNYSEKNEHGRM